MGRVPSAGALLALGACWGGMETSKAARAAALGLLRIAKEAPGSRRQARAACLSCGGC
jgi:hypothetical protein